MRYDVIIVGSGPAGSTAPRECALQGLNTLVIEKEKLPRHKPCGGAVSSKALSLLDFRIRDDLVEGECYGSRLHYGRYEIEARKPDRIGIFTSRNEFDMYLVEKAIDANVELKDAEGVKSLTVGDSSVVVRTDGAIYKASAVIGADGVKSRVADYVRPRYNPNEVALAMETEIPSREEEIIERVRDITEVYFGITHAGYGWVFPKREHFSVGVAGLLSEFKEPKSVFVNFLKKLNFNTDIRFHAHLIPAGGYEREVCSDRIILVGDAAGYVDAFYGEGIQYAIHSGKLAADVILESHKKGDFSKEELTKYKELCYDAFGENLSHALKFSGLVYKYPDVFIKLFASNKSIIDKWLDVPAGRMDYKEFQRWLLVRMPYYFLKNCMWKIRQRAEF